MVIDTAYFLAILFVFMRITAFFLVTKVFFPNGTPVIMKGVLGLIISYCIVSSIDYSGIVQIENDFILIIDLICEVLYGLVLGFMVNLIFEMVKMAGALMDLQIGLSMMNVVDPSSQESNTIISNLTYNLAMVIFFISNGHHLLIKCLTKSFSVVTVGRGLSIANSFGTILDGFINYFEIGLRIAIPIILIILISEVTMALVSRSVPQINVMILGIPIKIIIGLVTFVALLPTIIKLLGYTFDGIDNIFEKILKSFLACPIIIAFAKDDKTEDATGKKLQDARKKGQIAKSKDVGLAVSLIACTLLVLLATGIIGSTLKDVMTFYMGDGVLTSLSDTSLKAIVANFLIKGAICILPVLIPILVAGIIGSMIQVGFLFTTEPLKFSLGKLNPINGFKNMFSKKSFLDLCKNMVVVLIIGFLAYTFIKGQYDNLLQTSNIRFSELGVEVRNLVVALFFRVCIFMVILAIIDYILQRRIFLKDMKMTKQEVKDEYKQSEGDPKVKSKIKQKQREIASRRMMEAVPDATVVITNPTHLAIAIKYEEGQTEAPKVVAKGADFIAIKIKEIAKENRVPIMENKPLARMIYEKVEINEEIPQDMYQAVAEILAAVYKLNKKL